jgi:hypothetical protein
VTARLRSRATAEIELPDWYDMPKADSLYPGREERDEFRRLLAQADDGLSPDGRLYPVVDRGSPAAPACENRNVISARAALTVHVSRRWYRAVEWWFGGLPDALLDGVVLRDIAGAVWLPGDAGYGASPRVPRDVALAALGS